ncbi:MAG: hypothetical protein QOH21_1670 [Acidobacteriota bacterium]|nr:hypothetical protein [Acidobacteriota bacterium]
MMTVRTSILAVLGVFLLTASAAAQNCPPAEAVFIDADCQGFCTAGTAITFTALTFPGSPQACWTFTWDFGDGTPLVQGVVVHHTFAREGPFQVRLIVSSGGPARIATLTISLIGSQPTPPEFVIAIPTPRPTVNVAVLFVASVNISSPLTEWSWNFGETSETEPFTTTATHQYKKPGTYPVTVRARNSAGFGSATRFVTVAPAGPQTFTLTAPAAHVPGSGGSVWRTDLHLFMPEPGTAPFDIELELSGVKRTLSIPSATYVLRDVLTNVSGADSAGLLHVSGTSLGAPQVWTRTYNVSGNGSFGQSIPALSAAATAAPAGGPLLLGGLEDNARFRTNLGLVNLGTIPIDVTITIVGRSLPPVHHVIPPGTLLQENLAAGGDTPFGVRIDTTDRRMLYAYASMIDADTNDPTFIEAMPLDQLTTKDTLFVPGVGKVGTWRSDLMLFNPHSDSVSLSIDYIDDSGNSIARAPLFLAPGESKTLHDVTSNPLFEPAITGNTIGAARISATGNVIPFVFGRTYNQQPAGTFGQGIASIGARTAKLELGRKAVLAGALQDDRTYTNLGLFSRASGPSVVRITLLRDADRAPLGTLSYPIGPGCSRILEQVMLRIDPTATAGTLQFELERGGPVWIYGSLVDRVTKDPEYVPATLLP